MDRGTRKASVLAALVFVALVFQAAPKAAAAFRNVQGGMEAPPFRLKDAAGGEVSLESYKGDKAVVVVFWAGWSERSLQELADLQRMVGELGGKGLKALAINVEHEQMTEDDLKAVRAKIAALGLSFPVLLDAGLETYRSYGVVAVPSTAVLGEGGIVRKTISGYPTVAAREMREQAELLLGLRKEEAAPAAVAALAAMPNRQALLNYNLARRLSAQGMDEMAEPKLRTAAEADPKWAAPRVLLGRILLARARKDKAMIERARKEFEAAVAAEPENVVARTGLARVYWAAGSAAEAEREVSAALVAGPSYTPALLLKAAILARNGKIPEAEKAVKEAIALNPMDAAAYALAGAAYEEAGALAQAAGMYRKAWQLSGD